VCRRKPTAQAWFIDAEQEVKNYRRVKEELERKTEESDLEETMKLLKPEMGKQSHVIQHPNTALMDQIFGWWLQTL
jgi:hypothetical protein